MVVRVVSEIGQHVRQSAALRSTQFMPASEFLADECDVWMQVVAVISDEVGRDAARDHSDGANAYDHQYCCHEASKTG